MRGKGIVEVYIEEEVYFIATVGIVVDGVPSIGQALSGPPLAMDLEYNLYLHIMHIHFIMATLPRSNRCLWVAILITVHGTYGKALY
jgi:hypothetical protein